MSPADCTVLSFGSSDCDGNQDIEIDQVKGLTYPLKTFLGSDHQMLTEICKGEKYKYVRILFLLHYFLNISNFEPSASIHLEKSGVDIQFKLRGKGIGGKCPMN